jgi:hypothetical protein
MNEFPSCALNDARRYHQFDQPIAFHPERGACLEAINWHDNQFVPVKLTHWEIWASLLHKRATMGASVGKNALALAQKSNIDYGRPQLRLFSVSFILN